MTENGLQEIAVVDDDPGVADSLKILLETAGYRVTLYSDGVSFLASDLQSFEGWVLLDVRMPEKDGLTVLEEALLVNPNLYVVMMSGHGDVPMAVKALKKGAMDFFEKPFKANVIINAMDKADASVRRMVDAHKFVLDAKKYIAKLTPREREITEKLVEGKPNKIIAFELEISIRTVETHRAHILAKVQVRSLAKLVKIYLAATQ